MLPNTRHKLDASKVHLYEVHFYTQDFIVTFFCIKTQKDAVIEISCQEYSTNFSNIKIFPGMYSKGIFLEIPFVSTRCL